jgi:hypothetical protein
MAVDVILAVPHGILAQGDVRAYEIVWLELATTPQVNVSEPSIGRLVDMVVVTEEHGEVALELLEEVSELGLFRYAYTNIAKPVTFVAFFTTGVPVLKETLVVFLNGLKLLAPNQLFVLVGEL